MDDIENWLENHGLGKYASAFIENELELGDLSDLSEDDLEKLGLPMGPRKRLLKILAAQAALLLPAEESENADSSPVTSPQRLPATSEAERRQLTVMFADLVGSTALSASMDPEDYRELIRAYQGVATATIGGHDGFISRFMGDGILVYFGYPQAREDDPERAVRAGLALIDAVGSLRFEPPLAVRVGIATGSVVVGDIIGEGASEEAAVLGETPNLAARLQSLALPNVLLISPATQGLLGGRVESVQLNPVALKGLSQLIAPFRVVRTRSVSEVSEARVDSLPLVGREVEIALLQRAWRMAQSSEGQVVLLSGEAGVGKSRLLRALQEAIQAEDRTRVLWYCSPHYQTTANYPVIEQLRQILRFDPDSVEPNLDQVEHLLDGLGLDVAALTPVVALLLSIPTGSRYPAVDCTPEELSRKTISAQVQMLRAACAQGPVLFVVEDLQWADPTTLDVLGQMIDAIRDQPVLMLMTSRPDFRPVWMHHPHTTTHSVGHLNRYETIELVRCIFGERGLSDDAVEKIVERADGVPLFIEELTKTLLESAQESAVPASLQDSLMARLDRLGAAKELAQAASIIGRNFSLNALCAIVEQPIETVQAGLQDLTGSGLVYIRRGHGEAEYEFKHALLRDSAYESMLRERRRVLHRRAAQVLLRDFPDISGERPELVAFHYAAADEYQQASRYWKDAGQRGVQRFENAEAVRHFRSALECLDSLPPSQERDAEELQLLLALGTPTLAVHGYAAPDVKALYERARLLSARLDDHESSFVAVRGLWHNLLERGDLKDASQRAEELKVLAEATGQDELRAASIRALGSTLFLLGKPKRCLTVLDGNAYALGDSGAYSTASRHGDASGIAIGLYQASAEILLGLTETGSRRLDAAIEEADNLGDPLALAFAHCFRAICALYRAQPDAVLQSGERALELARTNGLISWEAHASCTTGWALAKVGEAQVGIERIRAGIQSWQHMNAQIMLPVWSTLLAEALLFGGEIEEALEHSECSLKRLGNSDEAFYCAEIWRVRGDLLCSVGEERRHEAEHCYREASRIARAQETNLFQLRADIRRARLLGSQGRGTEARSILQSSMSWFTEGMNEPDYLDAVSLLGRLS